MESYIYHKYFWAVWVSGEWINDGWVFKLAEIKVYWMMKLTGESMLSADRKDFCNKLPFPVKE